MTIYDISPLIHSGAAVWPGDQPFRRSPSLRIERGDSVNLSSVRMSLHVGAHADAPNHFDDAGAAIDEVLLGPYFGPARLITLTGTDGIDPAELEPFLRTSPRRLLVRCNPFIDPDEFPREIRYFTPEAAQSVAEAGVELIGTDAPSVDPLKSRDLPAHKAFGQGGVAILENLLFRGVPDGEYELAALPLKIAGGDGSPVRAVLRG